MKKFKQSVIAMSVLVTATAAIALSMSPITRAHFTGAVRSGVPAFLLDTLASGSSILGQDALASTDSFHFLEPIAPSSGDPEKFDRSLLNYLAVEICEVGSDRCALIKRFTAQDTNAEQLRIESTGSYGSYYIANWDTLRVNLNNKTYRVRVTLGDLELNAIDLTPERYNTFGRTWPIKFLIEKDPALRLRLLRSLSRSCSQAASILKNEYGLTAEETALLLANDPAPCSPAEIELALRGVYQAAVIPATTKVSDEATRNALTNFDPITGKMAFSTKTTLLGSLKPGDVLVSEPGAAAPNGYLRKVRAIKKENGGFVLDTTQATFNDAIQQGTLDAAATLRPSDLLTTETALPGVTFRTLSRDSDGLQAANVIGDDYDFETSVDITIDGATGGGGVNGDGHVRIQGYIRFNAGYDLGFGVEPCLEIPPVCVDRVEGRVGADQYSNLRVSGEFNGTLLKEIKLSTHYFKPIVFFIGPVPVVLVPVINVVVGVNGEAHLKFSFAAELSAQLLLGAKWTEDRGWEDLSRKNGVQVGITEQNLDANMKLRTYGKADAKLLFYGVAGPGFDSRVGGGVDVQVPRRPWWRIFGYIGANINFQVDLGGIIKLSEFSKTVLDEEFTLVDAPNQAPRFTNVNTSVIQADIGTLVILGPRSGFTGYFDVKDLEGDTFTLTATSNVDGPIGLSHRFQTGGLRTITITATDSQGASSTISLTVNINNSLPTVSLQGANAVPATVQYFARASAYDWETGQLGCGSLAWQVAPATATVTRQDVNGTCYATIVFQQVGQYTLTVNATDPHGGIGSNSLLVTVTTAPINRPPVVDLQSLSITAVPSPGVDTPGCPIFLARCEVPDHALLYNGQTGDYRPPLYMSISASDPEGDPITTQWFCRSGTQFATVTALGGGLYSCSPIYSTLPIDVYVVVSDGVNPPLDPVGRTFFMLGLVN